MKNKKGQINIFQSLGTLGIGIASLAIILTVGFLIIGQGLDVLDNDISSVSITNESRTFTNATITALTITHAFELTCSNVYNTSANDQALDPALYTCGPSGIIVTADSSDNMTANIFVDYSYKIGNVGYNGTALMKGAIDDVPGWIPLIVIAFIGGLLLSLVAVFRQRG